MKDIVIIVGTVLLGCILFNMIVGDEGSLRAVSGDKMEEMIQLYQE